MSLAPHPTPGWSSGPLRALGYRFAVRTTDPAAARLLDALVAGWRDRDTGSAPAPVRDAGSAAARVHDAGSAAARVYDVEAVDEDAVRRYGVRLDGEVLRQGTDPAGLAATLLTHVNRQVIEHTGGLMLFHAAAAARGGVAVVAPAEMEAGKTTLAAGLVRAGWSYLTDETAAVDPVSHLVHPYAKPLSIDRGSWPALRDLEPPDPDGCGWYDRQWQVPATAIRADAFAGPAPARLLVFPRYTSGGATRLEPLRAAEAVVELAANLFGFHDDAPGNLERLGALALACDSYRLSIGDLDAAVDAVDEAAARLSR